MFEKGDEGFLAQLPLGTLLPGTALPSGAGYAFAGEGLANKLGQGFVPAGALSCCSPVDSASFSLSGTATFSGADLVTYVTGSTSGGTFTGAPGGGLSDGTIGWGRWTTGTFEGSIPLQDYHYVVGVPTPDADMANLANQNLVGTYSLLGFTFPTSRNGLTGTVTSASLIANFGSGSVIMPLGVAIASQQLDLSFSGGISSGSGFNMSGRCLSQSCFGLAAGFFVGPNASHAGVVYAIDGVVLNSQSDVVNGAVTFRQSSLGQGLPSDVIR